MGPAAGPASNAGSLFRRLLGDSYDALPPPVRAVHDKPSAVFSGRCDIERGGGWLSRLLAAVSSLPPAGLGREVRVTIESDARGETWTRDFGGKPMRSVLRKFGSLLEERIGPTTFRFVLTPSAEDIHWKLVSVRSLGIPLPVSWFHGVTARETADGERYVFDVHAEVLLAGLLVHYRGYLDVR